MRFPWSDPAAQQPMASSQNGEVQMQTTIAPNQGGIARAREAFEQPAGLKIAAAPTYQHGPPRDGTGRFTLDQLRQTDAMVPLQSGTNQFASQQGMTGFGTPRNTSTHVVTTNPNLAPDEALHQESPERTYGKWTVEQLRRGDGILRLQSGSNLYASQKGMHGGFGAPRDVAGHHIHRIWEADGYYDQPPPEENLQQNYQQQM